MSSSTIRSAAPATTKYTLETARRPQAKITLRAAAQKLAPLMAGERRYVIAALAGILVNSGAGLIGPVIVSRTIDRYIRQRDNHGLLVSSAVLLLIYLAGVVASYLQVKTMGGAGRRMLFRLRNSLFTKLQELPVAFFNQNKAGDLISRLNNDTDKLNQFVGQALMQFVGSVFFMIGAGIFLLTLSIRLGIAALLPALAVFVFTKSTSSWLKSRNLKSLQSLGGMSSEVQESLGNFKVIVAFHRVDYFQSKFRAANEKNFAASLRRICRCNTGCSFSSTP